MRILYIGTGDIGVPALKWLLRSGHEIAAVVTQPDKPAGRRMELQASPIKQLALENGIRVLQPVKLRAAEAVAEVQALRADLIVVMAYGQILPKSVLDAARIACLNLHASILPRHRGAAPIQAAILAGDGESGITVMYMDEGLDTGDVLLVERVPIGAEETGGELHDALAEIAPAALERAVALLEAGEAPRTPQDNARATYAKKLERGDGAIDWTRPAEDLGRQVRAFNPWPGAFTILPGEGARKLKVFRVRADLSKTGVPGEVLAASPGELAIACGTGALLPGEVQLEGKKRMSISEFLRGNPIPPGAQFHQANAGGH